MGYEVGRQPSETSDVEEVEESLGVERQLEVQINHEAERYNLINNMPNQRSSLEDKYHNHNQSGGLNHKQTFLQPIIILLSNRYILNRKFHLWNASLLFVLIEIKYHHLIPNGLLHIKLQFIFVRFLLYISIFYSLTLLKLYQ